MAKRTTTLDVTHPLPTYHLGGTGEIQLSEYHILNTMLEAREDYITVESHAPANELENMMNSTNLTMSPQRCIFKVPNILKRRNPNAYAPDAFSIGPYHYGEEHLQATQKIKLMYLHDLISGFPGTDPKTMLRTLTGAISTVEQEARDCYADPIDSIGKDELVKILVLDGCFLIELFRKNADKNLRKDDDPVFTTGCMLEFLGHDMMLLENQIPWLVLELLFKITCRKPQDRTTSHLRRLVLDYCYYVDISLSRSPSNNKALLSREHESKHILDLLRNSLVLPSNLIKEESVNEESIEWTSMPSAARLREAGIKFKKRTESSKSILDIKFEDGVLKMPPLAIHEDTESLFRNLICLEQCLPNCAPRVYFLRRTIRQPD
ncbi:hypothetical protein TIFTF001_026297 [Ficus carica]|uniref:Uncharacterized protein n=1 Tax=Ficus carica TaxID=3494 RepID=A0AA88IYG7_FICCA|nr:hypothetical protein TIFTF001_026297 [Ficus carica]